MLGMFYILFMTIHAPGGGHRRDDSPPCTLRWAQRQGVHRGAVAPLVRVRGNAPKKKFGPYFPMGKPAHGFVHAFAHGFGA